MRSLGLACALLMIASPGVTSPTCKDRAGDTIRCGTAGAMPVGWAPPPGMLSDHRAAGPPAPNRAEIISMMVLIGAFITLIALMPDFDGARAGDWGAQEDDDDPPN